MRSWRTEGAPARSSYDSSSLRGKSTDAIAYEQYASAWWNAETEALATLLASFFVGKVCRYPYEDG